MYRLSADLDETLTACPICGGTDIPAFAFMHVKGYRGHLAYANCQNCGQVFLNPRMSDEHTAAYYQGEYRNRLLGPTGMSEQDITAMRLRASLQAQVLTIWGVVPFTVLDIGAAAGYTLWEWEKRGAKCTGIEPDARYHELNPAKRYKMYGDISELPAAKFDLISMSHVLEHLNHPKEYLQHLADTYENQYLAIEVPNSECCTAAYRIHHPMAFTRYTLEKLLSSVGYEPAQHFYHGLGNSTVHRYLLELFKKGKPNDSQTESQTPRIQ